MIKILEAKIEDCNEIEKVAKKSPPLRASISGTYEYFVLCFSKYFLKAFDSENTKIAGFIVGFPNIFGQSEFWVYQIAVLEEFRKKGIATQLYLELINRAHKIGNYKNIYTEILLDNIPSKNLHKKLGFIKLEKNIFREADTEWELWYKKIE